MDDGRIRIHKRCRYLWECLKGWTYDVPQGVDMDFISRAYIGPKKDNLSHGGDAFRYLAVAFMMNYKKKGKEVEEDTHNPLPRSLSHGLARMAR